MHHIEVGSQEIMLTTHNYLSQALSNRSDHLYHKQGDGQWFKFKVLVMVGQIIALVFIFYFFSLARKSNFDYKLYQSLHTTLITNVIHH